MKDVNNFVTRLTELANEEKDVWLSRLYRAYTVPLNDPKTKAAHKKFKVVK